MYSKQLGKYVDCRTTRKTLEDIIFASLFAACTLSRVEKRKNYYCKRQLTAEAAATAAIRSKTATVAIANNSNKLIQLIN